MLHVTANLVVHDVNVDERDVRSEPFGLLDGHEAGDAASAGRATSRERAASESRYNVNRTRQASKSDPEKRRRRRRNRWLGLGAEPLVRMAERGVAPVTACLNGACLAPAGRWNADLCRRGWTMGS